MCLSTESWLRHIGQHILNIFLLFANVVFVWTLFVLNISQVVLFIFEKGQTKQTDNSRVIFSSSEALIPHCHTRNLVVLLIRLTFYNTVDQCLDTCKFINYMRQNFSINLLTNTLIYTHNHRAVDCNKETHQGNLYTCHFSSSFFFLLYIEFKPDSRKSIIFITFVTI